MEKVVNQGHGSQPKTDRNEALIKDYKAGMSMVDLIKKYNITHTRIYAILDRYYNETGINLRRRKIKKQT